MDEQQKHAMWKEWSEDKLEDMPPPYTQDDLEWAFKAGLSMGEPYGQTHERKVPMAGLHEMDVRSAYPESLVTRDEKRSYE